MSDDMEVPTESHHDEIVGTLLDLQARLRGEPTAAERRVEPPRAEPVKERPNAEVPAGSDGVTVVYGDLSVSEAMPLAEPTIARPGTVSTNGPDPMRSRPNGAEPTVSVTSRDLTAMVGRVEAVLERLDRLESSLHQVMVRSAAAAVAASRGRDDVPDETAVAEELRHLATERLTHDSNDG
jgi:hypothetical protein